MHTPKKLLAFLEELGIAPKKGLSQNFLIDSNIAHKIVDSAALSSDDLVLEIGPGPGALTELLLAKGNCVVTIEKDYVLGESLKRLNTEDNRLTVFIDDALTFTLEETFAKLLVEGKKGKIIANLPYQITSPLLAKLLPLHHLFSKMVFMVQKEVADRITAAPGSKDFSSLGVLVQFYSHPKYLFTVSHNCFFPKPKVESAVISLDLHPPPPVSSIDGFFRMTRSAFGKRRKMLTSSLSDLYDKEKLKKALLQANSYEKARPEELSLEQWVAIFTLLHKS